MPPADKCTLNKMKHDTAFFWSPIDASEVGGLAWSFCVLAQTFTLFPSVFAVESALCYVCLKPCADYAPCR